MPPYLVVARHCAAGYRCPRASGPILHYVVGDPVTAERHTGGRSPRRRVIVLQRKDIDLAYRLAAGELDLHPVRIGSGRRVVPPAAIAPVQPLPVAVVDRGHRETAAVAARRRRYSAVRLRCYVDCSCRRHCQRHRARRRARTEVVRRYRRQRIYPDANVAPRHAVRRRGVAADQRRPCIKIHPHHAAIAVAGIGAYRHCRRRRQRRPIGRIGQCNRRRNIAGGDGQRHRARRRARTEVVRRYRRQRIYPDANVAPRHAVRRRGVAADQRRPCIKIHPHHAAIAVAGIGAYRHCRRRRQRRPIGRIGQCNRRRNVAA